MSSSALVALALAVCTTAATPAAVRAQGEVAFERHEVVTGHAGRQTVLTGDLLGDAVAELVVLHLEGDGERRLNVFALADGTWASHLEATLRPGVRFVDIASIAGRDRLITFERGRLNWFDPVSATEHELLEVAMRYNGAPGAREYAGTSPLRPTHEPELPHIEVTRDLNRDGRDDLILPDVDGFWVSVQTEDGTFSEPLKIGPSEPFLEATAFDETRPYGQVGLSPVTIPWYLSRVHEVDWDRDGRSDLVFWNEDQFEIYRQNEQGLFASEPERAELDAPFDSDGAYALLFGFSDKSSFSLVLGVGKKIRQTMLRALRDMNGDGVADLVVHSLQGRGIMKQRSRYEVYLGAPAEGGIAFPREPSTQVEPRGRTGAGELAGYSSLWLRDFDGDGQVEILRSDIVIGVGAIVRALLGSSVSVSTELFRMEDGAYSGEAARTQELKVDVKFRGRGEEAKFFPPVLVGDVNGDGRADLLTGRRKEEMLVFLGVPGPELLAREPQRVPVTFPAYERNNWLVDLDRDGKQDVLMVHSSTTRPHRVELLIAR